MDVKRKEWIVLPGMQDVYRKFLIVAKDYLSKEPLFHKQPLLLIGGSGVGKSLFAETAKQISLAHGMSEDSIIRLNCAAFTNELADSEIFGHVRGAFTGALKDKKGLVEVADGGLLILDEIGELSDEVQAKLLIFIEEVWYRPVGGTENKTASLKIIGTTNKSQDSFRKDFWYRFFPIFVPSIYERRLDVLYFIACKYPDIFTRLTPQHALTLLAHNWPGNIREIERVISLMMLEDSLVSGKTNDLGAGGTISWRPLSFALDARQTSLSISFLHDFCVNLDNNAVDVPRINKIISKYGIAIPVPIETSDSVLDSLISIKKDSVEYLNSALGSESVGFAAFEGFVQDNNEEDKGELNHDEDESDLEHEENRRKLNSIFSSLPMTLKFMEHAVLCDEKFYKSTVLPRGFVTVYEPYVGVCNCNQVDVVESIGVCFESLCRLFFRDPRSCVNVFCAEKKYMLDTYWSKALEKKIFKKFYRHNIVRQALEFVVGNKIVVKYECNFSESWRMHVKQLLSKDEFVKVFNNKTDNPKKVCFKCFDLNENELRKKYYKYLMDRYKTKTKAAEHAGLECSTFSKRLERLDFSQG